MGKSAPAAPAPPDASKTAAAQAAANKEAVRESALVSQINQQTPFGSLTYSGDIGSPDRTVTQTLAPAQQQMLDASNQAGIRYGQIANDQLSQVAGNLSNPFNIGSLGPVPTAGDQGWQRAYDAIIARNQPQMDQQRAALETRLANQGIDIGSQAYMQAMDDFNRAQNDFRLGAQGQATAQQQAQYGMNSAAYNQALQAALTGRQTPINELAALLSGVQVQQPNYVSTGQYQVNPADIMGAIYGNYNGQLNAYNSQLQNQAANRQGLFDLLGAGAMAYAYNPMAWSDRRLKRDIVRIGQRNGLPLYVWRYVWGTLGIGHMADEVRKVRPDAVHRVNGYDAVDYGALA